MDSFEYPPMTATEVRRIQNEAKLSPPPPPPAPPAVPTAGVPKKLTGGSSDYYKVKIEKPTTEFKLPYEAECNDIIEALNMSFAEGNVFKALWRRAAARLDNGKPGTTSKYDAEKMVFFSKRELAKETA